MSVANSLNFVCLPFFTGKNPSKQNRSHGKPEFTKAGTKAVAPGNVSTFKFSFMHSRTNKNPGSEMAGVPASLTNAICLPSFKNLIISANAWCSLC